MDDREADGPRTLQRIADALGIPVEQLFLPDENRGGPAAALRSEVRALVRAFSHVTNPETRALLIRMAEDAARGERAAVDPAR